MDKYGEIWRNIKIMLSPVYTLQNYSLHYAMPNKTVLTFQILSQKTIELSGDSDCFIKIKTVLWGEPSA